MNGLVILVSQELTPFYKKFGKKYPKLSESKVFSAFRVVRTFLLVAAIRSLDLLTLASGKKGLLSLPVSALIVLAAAVLLLVIGEHRMRKLQNPAARMGASLSLFLLTLVFGAYGAGYDVASFIYTRF
ncbi:MAG: hypothetical protein LBC41_10405 [Clostridiales bacterium]|nr:hypothetical protein [Clostridiales bacterium]